MQKMKMNPIQVPICIDVLGKIFRYMKKMEHLGKKNTAPTTVAPANMIYKALISSF
jgi:hypothetical protein